MIIEKLEESKILFRKEILNNLKRFFTYVIAALVIILLSAAILFYVEECYFYVPQKCPTNNEQTLELCQSVDKINKTLLNDIEAVDLYTNVTKFCNASLECKIDRNSGKSCTLDHKKLFKWIHFMMTTIFTVGKLFFISLIFGVPY